MINRKESLSRIAPPANTDLFDDSATDTNRGEAVRSTAAPSENIANLGEGVRCEINKIKGEATLLLNDDYFEGKPASCDSAIYASTALSNNKDVQKVVIDLGSVEMVEDSSFLVRLISIQKKLSGKDVEIEGASDHLGAMLKSTKVDTLFITPEKEPPTPQTPS